MNHTWPYLALAAAVGVPAGFVFAALLPALAAALVAANLALSIAFRIWGDETDV